MEIELAMLPGGHRRPRFERLMARRLGMKRFVEDEIGLAKAGVDIAVRPLNTWLAERHLTLVSAREVLRRPLHGLQLAADEHIAVASSVRAGGPQAVERIDHKWQRLEIERDSLDRLGGGEFTDGGHGENGFALVERLVGQRHFRRQRWPRVRTSAGFRRSGKIVGGQDAFDPGHRQRRAGVDPSHAAVRHRAQEQLAERHPVNAVVFRVFRATGHLGDQVGRRVIAADQFVVRHRLYGYSFSWSLSRTRHR